MDHYTKNSACSLSVSPYMCIYTYICVYKKGPAEYVADKIIKIEERSDRSALFAFPRGTSPFVAK